MLKANARSSWFVLLTAAAASLAVACNKPAENNTAPAPTGSTSASVVAPATPEQPPHHGMKGMKGMKGGHGMRGGPSMMLFRAARDQKLTDAQTTKLDDIQKGMKDGETPKDEMKTMHDDLVAGIKAGKIDTAKVEADQTAVQKAMDARRDKEAESLNALHAALDPAQRKAVVADVREKMKKRDEMAAKWKDKKGGDDKDKDGDKDKDKGGQMKGPGAHMGPGGPGGHMGFFAKDLGLDDAQQKKVQAVFDKAKADNKATPPDFEAMKKKWDALLTEFEKDTFDAKKLEMFTDKGDAKMMMGPMNPKVLNEVLPILKPEQREKLAARMEKGPMMHKGGPGMAPPAPSAAPGGDDDDDGDDDGK